MGRGGGGGGNYPPPPPPPPPPLKVPFSRSTPSPFPKIPLFLENQDFPTFYRPIAKTKVLNDSFN